MEVINDFKLENDKLMEKVALLEDGLRCAKKQTDKANDELQQLNVRSKNVLLQSEELSDKITAKDNTIENWQ